MRRFGYPQSFATGVIAAGGTLGIIILLSTVFAIYGLITEQDVGKLFIAGIIPGILAILDVHDHNHDHRLCAAGLSAGGRARAGSEKLAALKDIWLMLLLFAFVIGGLYGGLFTATVALARARGAHSSSGGRAPQAGRPWHPECPAGNHAHHRGGVHHPDRRAAVRLFPHHHADPAEGSPNS